MSVISFSTMPQLIGRSSLASSAIVFRCLVASVVIDAGGLREFFEFRVVDIISSLLTISRIFVKSKVFLMRDVSVLTYERVVLVSMPESSTAQTMFLQPTLNNDFAASPFTAGTDRSSAAIAGRFRDTWKI